MGDYQLSCDLDDLIAVVDGRPALEVAATTRSFPQKDKTPGILRWRGFCAQGQNRTADTGISVRMGGGDSGSDVDRLAELRDLVEAGTEALVLVDMATELERALVSALWAADDGDDALAEKFLLAALDQARARHLLADESE